MLHADARLPRRRALAALFQRELTLSFPHALAGLLLLALVGSGASYRTLLTVVDSESPDSLLVAVPFVALALLALRLRDLGRHGHEVGINMIFATPLAFILVGLLLWLPPRFSSFYWVNRIDLLALPLLLAVGVLLLFGLPALLSSWRVFGLLLLGWKPIFDQVVALLADPLASLDAFVVGLLATPFAPHAHRVGQLFFLGRDGSESVGISSACAGLAAIFSMLLVGAFVGPCVAGSRRAKLWWFASALALTLLANLIRLTVVIVVAAHAGTGAAFSIFHATAGVALFSVCLLVMLVLLPRFGLRLGIPPLRAQRPLRFKARGLAIVTTLLVGLALVGAWAEAGFGFYGPGSFARTPVLAADDLLPPPAGVDRIFAARLSFIDALFGDGARSYQYDYRVPRTDGIGAQIVVVPSYRQATSYGPLDCFIFHRYGVYATRLVQLRNGGSALLAALKIGDRDVATISWLQPVRVEGKAAWRRVTLFQYLTGKPVGDDFRPSLSRRVGYWLLNTLAPYGSTRPPARFTTTERELRAFANGFSVRSSS